MACDFEHPCGGRILPDLEFNTAMERAGISVRRGSCLLGAHSLYAYRVHVTACLHGHAPGEHHLAELRACGVCKVRHLIPGCSVCTGARAVSREEYESELSSWPPGVDTGRVWRLAASRAIAAAIPARGGPP